MRINSAASSLIVQDAVEKNMNRANELTARKSSDFSAVRYSDLGSRISSVINSKISSKNNNAMQQKYNDMQTNIALKSSAVKNIRAKLSDMMVELVRMNQGYTEDGAILASGKMLKGHLEEVINQLNTKGSTNKYIFSGNANRRPIHAQDLMKTDFTKFNPQKPSYYHGTKLESKYFLPNQGEIQEEMQEGMQEAMAPKSINASARGFTDILSSVTHLLQVMESEKNTAGMPKTRKMISSVYSTLSNVSNKYMPQYINDTGIAEQVFNNFHKNMKKITDVYHDAMIGVNDKKKIEILYKIMSNSESLQTNLELSKKLMHNVKDVIKALSDY